MLKKILIANRGEIARRINKTAQRLGIKTVVIYSDIDKDTAFTSEANVAIPLSHFSKNPSYLNGDLIIKAMLETNSEAVHPGYGFLSENAYFANKVNKAGLVFVGPSSKIIRSMGLKNKAKEIVQKLGIQTIPGYSNSYQDVKLYRKEAKKLGFPILIKAIAGGGGRGIRLAQSEDMFNDLFESAKREALSSYENKNLILEKFFPSSRHIEVQIFGDSYNNVVHLYERDCSVQRNYQKVIEETPASSMPTDTMQRLHEAAVKIGKSIGYVGAGTVEFLVDQDHSSYFMEMNTRLQVEHPITECITGLDLVEWQFRIASGEKLPLNQGQIQRNGHSIEARLYAECPEKKFIPQIGQVSYFNFSNEPGIRIDTGIKAGDTITHHYDPMIAKIISHGSSREKALKKLERALGALHITGIETNQFFLRYLIKNQTFINSEFFTTWLDNIDWQTVTFKDRASPEDFAIAAFFIIVNRINESINKNKVNNDPFSPWFQQNGWRLNGKVPQTIELRDQFDDVTITITAISKTNGWQFLINNNYYYVNGDIVGNDLHLTINNQSISSSVIKDNLCIYIKRDTLHIKLLISEPFNHDNYNKPSARDLTAPIPSVITGICAIKGQAVKKGVPLLLLEAMKMEHIIVAPSDGRIKSFLCKLGDTVEEGKLLVLFDPIISKGG